MTSVWKRLQRVGKRAAKFQFVACYHELVVECTKKWQPDKLVVVWTRRNRRICSKAHSWQPGIQNPYRGTVVWMVPENVDISVTLYRDPHVDQYEAQVGEGGTGRAKPHSVRGAAAGGPCHG